MNDSAAKAYIEKYKRKFSRAMIERQLLKNGATKEQIARLYNGNILNTPSNNSGNKIKQSENIEPKKDEYASFLMRTLATIFDIMIFYLVMLIIITPYIMNPNNSNIAFLIAGPPILILGLLIYFPVMHASKKQASMGKIILKMKVVDENHNRISVLKGFGRFGIKFLIGLFTIGLGFLYSLMNDKKQSLHDLAVKTYVVSTDKVETWIVSLVAGIVVFLIIAFGYLNYIGFQVIMKAATGS